MAKFRDRVCIVCGDIEYNTATKSETCIKCYAKAKREKKAAEERELLEGLYESVSGHVMIRNKPFWTFTHQCGTEQTWVFGNILKRLKEDPANVPCSKCGSLRRAKNWHAGYMKIYGFKDLVAFARYSKRVRCLSDQNYLRYKDEINPLNLPRGRYTYHLDHKIPIIVGFRTGMSVEEISKKENLQMLPAAANLAKGRK